MWRYSGTRRMWDLSAPIIFKPPPPVQQSTVKSGGDDAKPAAVVAPAPAPTSEAGVQSRTTVTLSILLGTYNRKAHLVRAIESARASVRQLPYKLSLSGGSVVDASYEFVVCDGGSTDGSRVWLAEQPDVTLLGDRQLDGGVVAFNRCFQMSRGEYIATLNDDCCVHGDALAEGLRYLQGHPSVGQVAFGFGGEGSWHVNRIYPNAAWPTEYANYGIIRRELAEAIWFITGGFWAPHYWTYAGDCELSAWVHRLGWKVAPLLDLHVADLPVNDALRARNYSDRKASDDAERFFKRWPADSLRPDGPPPQVTADEWQRFLVAQPLCHPCVVAPVQITGGELVSVASLDPEPGKLPIRAAVERLGTERVLHVHMQTQDDPQAGLTRALATLASPDGYAMIDWLSLGSEQLQKEIVSTASRVRPTVVFMQLQKPNVVLGETLKALRNVADSSCVIATWCGDVAAENALDNIGWQVEEAPLCDLTLHSSMAHVRAMRSRGTVGAAYLQIGFDEKQYDRDAAADRRYDVSFLGAHYASHAFSASLKNHDAALRNAAVSALRDRLGGRFGLYGGGHPGSVVPMVLAKAHTVYQASAMALSISLLNDLELYTSDRLLRILGCGCAALVKRFPRMDSYGLVDGVNCLCWDTVEELIAKTQDWLLPGRSEMLGLVQEAARQLAHQNHTWGVRMLELIPLLDAVRNCRTRT